MMNDQSWKWLNVLINRYHAHDPEALLRLLPEGEEELAKKHHVDSTEISPVSIQPHNFLDRMHYSWMLSPLQSLEKATRPIYLSVLLPGQRAKLAEKLGIEAAELKYPSLIADLIRYSFFKKLAKKALQPPVFIETNELSALLYYSKKSLMEVISFLGIRDLAPEFKASIDQKLKDKVFRLMTEEQRKYLMRVISEKQLRSNQQGLLAAASMRKENFQKIIHRHGIAFLGSALAGLPEDFLWYFTRVLDVGRAKLLKQYYSKDVPLAPERLAELRREVIHLANTVEQRGHT